MSLCANNSELTTRALIDATSRVDEWLANESAAVLLQENLGPQGQLRVFKAQVEVLFWLSQVSPRAENILDRRIIDLTLGSLDWAVTIAHVRYNPSLVTLLLLLASCFRAETIPQDVKSAIDGLEAFHRRVPEERLHFRQMDLLHARTKWHKRDWPTQIMGSLRKKGILNSNLLPFIGSEQLYALTHSIFYLTDFGRMPDHLLSTEGGLRWKNILETHIHRTLSRTEYDICFELILCYMMLFDRSPLTSPEILYVCDAALECGYWSGPDISATILADGIAEASISYFAHYHTAILGRDVLQRLLVLENEEALRHKYTQRIYFTFCEKKCDNIVDIRNKEDALKTLTQENEIMYGINWLVDNIETLQISENESKIFSEILKMNPADVNIRNFTYIWAAAHLLSSKRPPVSVEKQILQAAARADSRDLSAGASLRMLLNNSLSLVAEVDIARLETQQFEAALNVGDDTSCALIVWQRTEGGRELSSDMEFYYRTIMLKYMPMVAVRDNKNLRHMPAFNRCLSRHASKIGLGRGAARTKVPFDGISP
ncbi:DUF6895 family protein [Rhizobium leguminosarum]|uniref:DUF6895 family protein n=1 Tax=Rhizobium leguminosarum TaxID=384 RepID=UPI0036D7EF15